jgi:hypothetical protein
MNNLGSWFVTLRVWKFLLIFPANLTTLHLKPAILSEWSAHNILKWFSLKTVWGWPGPITTYITRGPSPPPATSVQNNPCLCTDIDCFVYDDIWLLANCWKKFGSVHSRIRSNHHVIGSHSTSQSNTTFLDQCLSSLYKNKRILNSSKSQLIKNQLIWRWVGPRRLFSEENYKSTTK